MIIEVNPKTLLINLLYLITFLLFANCIGLITKFYFGHDVVYGLVPLFDFNTEKNIPTFYSSCALIIVSVLSAFIALTHKKQNSSYAHWLGLAIIFLFLSIDEIASIHERLIDPVKTSLNTSGLLFFAWVIPYGIALMIFVVAYAKFLMNLPKKIMVLFIISGTIFVSGAIGVELFEGKEASLNGYNTLVFALYYTFEEFLEMLGIVIFIYTLLLYTTIKFEAFTVSIVEKK